MEVIISRTKLWRGTHREEYARLQTFPDDWVFVGGNKRDIHSSSGNAVPVRFAEHLASNVKRALECIDRNLPFLDRSESARHSPVTPPEFVQLSLF